MPVNYGSDGLGDTSFEESAYLDKLPHAELEEFKKIEDYPTEWKMFNKILDIECRQTSLDTYQLRSPSHILTLNREGFALYRDDSPQGQVIFEDWCERNGVVSVPRDSEAESDES